MMLWDSSVVYPFGIVPLATRSNKWHKRVGDRVRFCRFAPSHYRKERDPKLLFIKL
jgi:hypothetical protein